MDAFHTGEWKKETAADDIDTAKSRTGFVIMFGGYPHIWSSKLQTEIALSSTKAEYIALSTATREVIHLVDFLQECDNIRTSVQGFHPIFIERISPKTSASVHALSLC